MVEVNCLVICQPPTPVIPWGVLAGRVLVGLVLLALGVTDPGHGVGGKRAERARQAGAQPPV